MLDGNDTFYSRERSVLDDNDTFYFRERPVCLMTPSRDETLRSRQFLQHPCNIPATSLQHPCNIPGVTDRCPRHAHATYATASSCNGKGISPARG
eukprot:gene12683-biopygen1207